MWETLQKSWAGEWIEVKKKKCLLLDSPSTLALFNLGLKAFLEPQQIAGGLSSHLLLDVQAASNLYYKRPHSKPFCVLDSFCIEDDFLRIDPEK